MLNTTSYPNTLQSCLAEELKPEMNYNVNTILIITIVSVVIIVGLIFGTTCFILHLRKKKDKDNLVEASRATSLKDWNQSRRSSRPPSSIMDFNRSRRSSNPSSVRSFSSSEFKLGPLPAVVKAGHVPLLNGSTSKDMRMGRI